MIETDYREDSFTTSTGVRYENTKLYLSAYNGHIIHMDYADVVVTFINGFYLIEDEDGIMNDDPNNLIYSISSSTGIMTKTNIDFHSKSQIYVDCIINYEKIEKLEDYEKSVWDDYHPLIEVVDAVDCKLAKLVKRDPKPIRYKYKTAKTLKEIQDNFEELTTFTIW
jgi:hypothetical protein